MTFVLILPCLIVAWRALGALVEMRPTHPLQVRAGAVCEAAGGLWGAGAALLAHDPLPGVALALTGAALLTLPVRRPRALGTRCAREATCANFRHYHSPASMSARSSAPPATRLH